MAVERQREIVIEFEKVKLIRKRAKTLLSYCSRCGSQTDLVSLSDAAELFEIAKEDLLGFVKENDCHYHYPDQSSLFLCVISLLVNMKKSNYTRRLTA